MRNKNYLLNVLTLSALPRIFSSLFSLISLPIMLHEVGAKEYGNVIYYGAVIAILEAFVDFGVSSAAGKELSSARVLRPENLLTEFFMWSRLQLTTSLIGITPLILISYLVISSSDKIEFNLTIFIFVLSSAWLAICSNFIRSALMAMLGFKSLAILDTFQSLCRSTSYLSVAYILPTTLGVVLAGFFTALFTSVLAVVLIWILFKRRILTPLVYHNNSGMFLSKKVMIQESLHFLWLRLAIRSFDSIPVLLFGRLLGSEVAGIFGTVTKLLELITFPFAVIGNALSVQSHKVINQSQEANLIVAFWDTIFRILCLSIFGVAFILLGNDYLSKIFYPNSEIAPIFIFVMSLQVLTSAATTIVGPISDYVGALKQRNILLTLISIVQIPILWFAILIYGAVAGILVYLFTLIIMNWGYFRISMSLFFVNTKYKLRREILYFVLLAFFSIITSLFVKLYFINLFYSSPNHLLIFISTFLIFIILMLIGIIFNRESRHYFFNKDFFDYEKIQYNK